MSQEVTSSLALSAAATTSTADSAAVQRYLDVCLQALRWAEARNYTGYSKFDALNSPLLKWLAGDRRLLRAGFTYLVSRAPFNIRPLLGVQKRQNPKGLALFSRSCFNLHSLTNEKAYLEKGLALLDRLLGFSQIASYSGHCWGYDHDWQNTRFLAPAYSPNAVVTVMVAEAFLDAFEQVGDTTLLGVARSSADFILRDLTAIDAGEGRYCCSYVPNNTWKVTNVNALAGALLTRLWSHTGEQALLKKGQAMLRWVVELQTDYGAWYYTDPPGDSRITHDNYHTGFVLDALLQYMTLTEDWTWRSNYESGLSFYREHLFLENGAPKWMHDRPLPFDILGSAQGILTFVRASKLDPAFLGQAQDIANWTLDNVWHPEGRFYYQRGKYFTKKFTLMDWSQAWMCFALSELCVQLERAASQ